MMEPDRVEPAARASLRIEDLSISFGSFQVLQNVTISFPDQSFSAIVGPNGAGKTTLIRFLAGLIDGNKHTLPDRQNASPERSTVEPKTPLNDKEQTTLKISYVPQAKTLDRTFPASVEELVFSGLDKSWPFYINKKQRQRVLSSLAAVGGENLVGKNVSSLSGGELQRVFLARACIANPDCILLDEPMTGIDMAGESDLYDLLAKYRKQNQASIIMITHDIEAAYYHCNHAVLLNKTVIAQGKPSEVLTGDNLRQAFGHIGHMHPALYSGAKHWN